MVDNENNALRHLACPRLTLRWNLSELLKHWMQFMMLPNTHVRLLMTDEAIYCIATYCKLFTTVFVLPSVLLHGQLQVRNRNTALAISIQCFSDLCSQLEHSY